MTETQLQAGNDIQHDRSVVYDQMTSMKTKISECTRKGYKTEDGKDDFDAFKQNLLTLCDEFVESQRKKLDMKFFKI